MMVRIPKRGLIALPDGSRHGHGGHRRLAEWTVGSTRFAQNPARIQNTARPAADTAGLQAKDSSLLLPE
jgi:hypothetical protein